MRISAAPTDMTQGKPLGLLLRFAIPLLIGNIFQQLYNLVDSLVVGNFIGTEALAAVSIGTYPIRVLLALFMGIGTGASIRISQYTGAGDQDGVRDVIQTANSALLLISIPLTILGLVLARPLLHLMNTPDDAMALASSYLSIVLLGTVGLLGYNLNAGILRGLGDSRTALLFLVISTVINMVLDLVFVAVLGWGVPGAAAATAIAMMASWVFSVLFIRKRFPQYATKLWPLRIHKRALLDMLRLGLPIGLNDALFSLGHMTLSSLINTHGTVFAAGYSVGTKVDAISFMPIASFSAATTTFVGQNVGAKQYDRVRQGARTALALVVSWSLFSCVMMLTLGHHLVRFFDTNPAVIEVGYAYIVRLEPFYWIYAIMYMLNAVMNGAGSVRVPMISNLVLFWAVRLPAAYLLSAHLPPNNIFFCFPISWAAGLLVSGTYYMTGRWRKAYGKEVSAL